MLNKSFKAIGIVVGILVLIILSFLAGSITKELTILRKGNTPTQEATAPEELANPYGNVEPVNQSDHIFGNVEARIALIEYSDFECFFCQQFHPQMHRYYCRYIVISSEIPLVTVAVCQMRNTKRSKTGEG